jgi:asparagine synthase (glutamine-hydrolysing)
LRAYTVVVDQLFADDERHFAGLAADAMDIPIHFLSRDKYTLYERWEELPTPEPVHNPAGLALTVDLFRLIGEHSRVVFYGEGPDNALYYEWRPYVRHLFQNKRWGRLCRDVIWHMRFHRSLPMTAIANRLRRLGKTEASVWQDPAWIRPELLRLATRAEKPRDHPIHPIGYNWLTGPLWDELFERNDASRTFSLVEVRHPYMDVRVIRFLLSTPVIPWCRGKYLLRRAFEGKLPRAIVQRPKTPLRGDAVWEMAKKTGLPQWIPAPALSRYVNVEKVNTVLVPPELNPETGVFLNNLRPISLNFFLRSLR